MPESECLQRQVAYKNQANSEECTLSSSVSDSLENRPGWGSAFHLHSRRLRFLARKVSTLCRSGNVGRFKPWARRRGAEACMLEFNAVVGTTLEFLKESSPRRCRSICIPNTKCFFCCPGKTIARHEQRNGTICSIPQSGSVCWLSFS